MRVTRIPWLSISHLIVAFLGIVAGIYYTIKNPSAFIDASSIVNYVFYHDLSLELLAKLIILGIASFFAVITSFYLFKGYQYFSLVIGLSTMIIVIPTLSRVNPLLFIVFVILGVFQIALACSICIIRK